MYVYRKLFFTIGFIFLIHDIFGQSSNERPSLLTIDYVLKAGTGNLSGYDVEMHLGHAPHHFQLAMATHHEYDDRFWRYVRNIAMTTPNGIVHFVKKDSALWDVTIPGDEADISYRIQLPTGPRFAHQPFLTVNGGLLGDIHSFMYVVGHEYNPSTVNLILPHDWQIVTGLTKTNKTNIFAASSAMELLDCPVLVGHLHRWKFNVNGISHEIAYLPVGDKLHFDSVLLVKNIQKIVDQTARLFGSIPYKNYVFLLEDGVNGALEHANSVTIGAPDTLLTNNMAEIYGEIAHEFSHTWNLMQIKPAGYSELNYGPKERSAGLWFSEGLAMFYADLLLRRAGLPVEEKTRLDHLSSLITRYYADTGNMVITPERVSLAANDDPGSLGDYSPSVHLQGELIGSMLDLQIRSATNGKRSFDDVMRLMFKRFVKNRGFYAKDVERAVMDVCQNNEVHVFFKNYLYEEKPIDFNKYLQLIGLQAKVTYHAAMNDSSRAIADNRIYIWHPHDDTLFHIILTTPAGCWSRAGLHTGDAIISINNQLIKTLQAFYSQVNNLKIGDVVTVQVKQSNGTRVVKVVLTGYQTPVTQITKIDTANASIRRLFEQWEHGI